MGGGRNHLISVAVISSSLDRPFSPSLSCPSHGFVFGASWCVAVLHLLYTLICSCRVRFSFYSCGIHLSISSCIMHLYISLYSIHLFIYPFSKHLSISSCCMHFYISLCSKHLSISIQNTLVYAFMIANAFP